MWKRSGKIKTIVFLSLAVLGLVVALLLTWFFPLRFEHLALPDSAAYFLLVAFGLATAFEVWVYARTRRRLQKARRDLHVDGFLTKEIGCFSDAGRNPRKKENEDGIVVVRAFSAYGQRQGFFYLLIMADGMGGHNKGEVASYLGATAMATLVIPTLISKEKKDFTRLLESGIRRANEEILRHSITHEECEGMGTTMTSVVVDQNRLYISHVGDTRAYLISEDEIKQLTKDHSLVQELVDKGEITPEEARHHSKKNVITRVIGYYKDVEPDLHAYKLDADDRILLCCDGLVGDVEDHEIKTTVLGSNTPKEACESLVKMANDRGGKDNISVIATPKISQLSWIKQESNSDSSAPHN